MKALRKLTLAVGLASFGLFSSASASTWDWQPGDMSLGAGPALLAAAGDKFYRTELYCGRSKPDGGMVSDEEWERFLTEVVTPRFPDGFTTLKATGQYREKSGKIISEPSNVLVFLYTNKDESRLQIEEIRAAYVKQFSQESVLRLDFKQKVEVSF
jgi:hypothetical protein